MIEIGCKCGARSRFLESNAGQTVLCPGCRTRLDLLSAERLSEGAGFGDFDTRLVVVSGPRRGGEQFFLGGVNDLTVGHSSEAHLFLPGELIASTHCRLQRPC